MKRAIQDITEFIFKEDRIDAADVIIVPGNRYEHMALEAARLYKEHYSNYIVVTGKHSICDDRFKGPYHRKYGEKFTTEAQFLESILVQANVPKSCILKEERATYTYQNALYTKEVLEQQKRKIKTAIICCRNVHARRCKMYFEWVFPDVTFYIHPVEVQGINKYNWMQTKKGKELVFEEYERIGTQFQMMLSKI